jgi:hypothetical protein
VNRATNILIKMSKQLNLKESFAIVNKRKRHSDEDIASSTLSSSPPLTSVSSISSSTATLPSTALASALVPTPSLSSQMTSSTTEPTTPPIFQLQATMSFSSPSKNSQLSIADEQDHDLCVLPSISSNTAVAAPTLIHVYDSNDIGKSLSIRSKKTI